MPFDKPSQLHRTGDRQEAFCMCVCLIQKSRSAGLLQVDSLDLETPQLKFGYVRKRHVGLVPFHLPNAT